MPLSNTQPIILSLQPKSSIKTQLPHQSNHHSAFSSSHNNISTTSSTNSSQKNLSVFQTNQPTLFTMKTFIILAAVIAVATAGAVRSSGWGAPASPSIDLELSAAAAAAASGAADANQQLIELVSGDSVTPAQLSSINGVLASVSQGEDITQIAVADKPSGATSTINAVDVSNAAIGLDTLDAALLGANGASVQNSAGSSSTGEGALAAEAASLNNVVSKRH